jgi:hypothetical protein
VIGVAHTLDIHDYDWRYLSAALNTADDGDNIEVGAE